MKQNVGNVERLGRTAVGLGLLSLFAAGPHSLRTLVGLVPLATGLVGFCPLYWVLDISTCSRERGCSADP